MLNRLKNTNYTPEQIEAIIKSNNNLLVSASAGSGKTRILVERVFQQLLEGVNIDEYLIVTFTRAAAQEMKDRIEKEIRQAIPIYPDKQHHLLEQLHRLPQAQISTIHSFCMTIVQRFYYVIDRDPIFRLLTDSTEIQTLKEQAYENVTEIFYGAEDPKSFFKLAQTFSGKNDDGNLAEIVESLHQLAIAHPEPRLWLEKTLALYEVTPETFGESILWQDLMKEDILDVVRTCKSYIESALIVANAEELLAKNIERLQEDQAFYQTIEEIITNDHLESLNDIVTSHSYSRWNALNKEAKEILADEAAMMKEYRDSAKKLFEDNITKKYAAFPFEDQIDMLNLMQPSLELLVETVTAYMNEYQKLKASNNLLDFNDLEHDALKILSTLNDEGINEAQLFYQNSFHEIMIDEYQDTNQLQEAILEAVSQGDQDGNRFMVGDMKQSIYRFRLADPTLFLDKYDRFGRHDGGEKIVLQKNFRSRAEVLDFTNLIFMQLMDHEVGDVVYDEEAELVTGFPKFPKSDTFAAELLLFEKENEDDTETYGFELIHDGRSGQVALIGQTVMQMIEEKFLIYDKDLEKERPITYADFAILTRTKSMNTDIQMIFQELDIPVALNSTDNYFQTTEISTILSLLRVLDNPHQDIPWAAVLRSPIVGLDENELAEIRIHDKHHDYYTATVNFLEDPKSMTEHAVLNQKLSTFFTDFTKWRNQARRVSVAELIWIIYEDTAYLEYVNGMPAGRQRISNLHALYERANDFEKTQFKGLYQFIQYIDRMSELDNDFDQAVNLIEHKDAVQVMTVHGSKGLEFPVVFYADASKNFNNSDYTGDLIVDENYGIGTKYINTDYRIKAHTFASTALAAEVKKANQSEELRNLYVALTRAEQKLFIVGTIDTLEKAYTSWGAVGSVDETVIPTYMRLKSRSALEWIGQAIFRHKDSEQTEFFIDNSKILNHPAQFVVKGFDRAAIVDNLQAMRPQLTEADWYRSLVNKDLRREDSIDDFSGQSISDGVQRAINRLNYKYPHEESTYTTSYQSVSEIKRWIEDPDVERLVLLDEERPQGQNRFVIDELERPRFVAEETAPTPAEIGMATHLVLQKFDFSKIPNIETIQATIDKLVAIGNMNSHVAERIDVEKLVAFFKTQMGKRIVQADDHLEREISFSLKLDANTIFKGVHEEDDILIHGIIDGYFEEEDGLILFDYKTDRVSHYGDEAFNVMTEKYQGQLAVYALALESILNKPVKEANLIILDLNETLDLIPSFNTHS